MSHLAWKYFDPKGGTHFIDLDDSQYNLPFGFIRADGSSSSFRVFVTEFFLKKIFGKDFEAHCPRVFSGDERCFWIGDIAITLTEAGGQKHLKQSILKVTDTLDFKKAFGFEASFEALSIFKGLISAWDHNFLFPLQTEKHYEYRAVVSVFDIEKDECIRKNEVQWKEEFIRAKEEEWREEFVSQNREQWREEFVHEQPQNLETWNFEQKRRKL